MPDPERDEPSLELELPRLRRRGRQPRRSSQEPAAEPSPVGGEQTAVLEVQEVADAPPARRAPRARPTLPSVSLPGGWPAVVVTGLVVGLVVVGLTWASLRTCEAAQGTSTCGRAGYPLLLVVLALAVIVGSALLRVTQVPDPVSTSLLGVGVAAVVALVVLIDHLDQPAMVIVIPLVCAATFAGSHWLTTSVIEPERD